MAALKELFLAVKTQLETVTEVEDVALYNSQFDNETTEHPNLRRLNRL